jgi:hypothetical protein
MEKIITQYQKKLQELEEFKTSVLAYTGDMINRYCDDKPLVIGNTSYSCEWTIGGFYIPTYLDSMSKEFKPIYDKAQTFDYGWADFDQVARILDVINNRLEEIKNNN